MIRYELTKKATLGNAICSDIINICDIPKLLRRFAVKDSTKLKLPNVTIHKQCEQLETCDRCETHSIINYKTIWDNKKCNIHCLNCFLVIVEDENFIKKVKEYVNL